MSQRFLVETGSAWTVVDASDAEDAALTAAKSGNLYLEPADDAVTLTVSEIGESARVPLRLAVEVG